MVRIKAGIQFSKPKWQCTFVALWWWIYHDRDLLSPSKSIVILFLGRVCFCALFEGMSNDWMVKLFFSGYFFYRPQNWMNEWYKNFSIKKKHTKMQEIKRTNFVKKRRFPQNPLNWPVNFLEKRKKKQVLFNPASRKWKKHHFGIRMNELPVNFFGEKNTIPLRQVLDN